MEELRIDSQHLGSGTEQATADVFAQAFIGKAFVDDTRKLNLNKLLHLAPYSEALLLVGEEGVGKSVLLQQFVARAKQLWKVVHITSSSLMTPIDVSRQIVHGFGLPSAGVDDVADLLSDIGRYLQALGRSGRRAVIVIDDVHLLQDEVVRLLETILDDGRSNKALGIVFSTDSKQVEKFARFAILQEKLAYTLRFEPLNEAGVKEYIRHRLEQAGRRDAMALFADSIINQIYSKSGGLPAAINELARKRLGSERLDSGLTEGRRLGIWIPAVLGVFIVAAVLVYQDEINRMVQAPEKEPAIEASPAQSIEMAKPDNAVDTARTETPPEPTARTEEKQVPLLAGLKMGDLANQQIVPAEGVEVKAVEEVRLPEPQPVVEPVVRSGPEVQQQEEIKPAQVAVKPTPKVAPPEPEQQEKTAKANPPAVEKPKGWIESQNPQYFTMQLMALRDEVKVKEFVDRNSKVLAGNSEIFYIKRKGKRLTALVYGSFASHPEAVTASKTLPKSWGKPWVRLFASVQKDMSK